MIRILTLAVVANVVLTGNAFLRANPRKAVAPNAVVAKWIELVQDGDLKESKALTTQSKVHSALHDVHRLAGHHQLRVDRVLSNDDTALVVTKSLVEPGTEQSRAFAFWLVKQNGRWLINMSYMDDAEDIDDQLRGFLMGGNPTWHVTKNDLIGFWTSGPGAPGGNGFTACGSEFHLKDNGEFSLAWWGPGGPLDGTEIEHGTWQLQGDRIVREVDGKQFVSRIAWRIGDSLTLQRGDLKWRRGWSGTHYRREHDPSKTR